MHPTADISFSQIMLKFTSYKNYTIPILKLFYVVLVQHNIIWDIEKNNIWQLVWIALYSKYLKLNANILKTLTLHCKCFQSISNIVQILVLHWKYFQTVNDTINILSLRSSVLCIRNVLKTLNICFENDRHMYIIYIHI